MAFRDALYERYATARGAHGAASTAWWQHKYLPLLRSVPKQGRVLEIGCGAGELLAFLKSRGFSNAQGIDISPEQVALARERGVDAEVGDALQLTGSYQLIIAVDVLEHFTRDELVRLARVLFEALAPGGKLLIQTANGAGLFPRQVIYGDLTHLTIFTPQSLGQLLRASGFENFAFYETGPIPLRLRGKVNVVAWQLIKQAVNIVRRVETGKSQAIWTENFICLAQKPG
jgi:SAM-dependent methyltransferase